MRLGLAGLVLVFCIAFASSCATSNDKSANSTHLIEVEAELPTVVLQSIAKDRTHFRQDLEGVEGVDLVSVAKTVQQNPVKGFGLIRLANEGCDVADTAFGDVELFQSPPEEKAALSRICLLSKTGQACDVWARVNRQQAKTMVCRAEDGSPIEYLLSLPAGLAADYPAASALSPHCVAKHQLMIESSTCSEGE